MLWIDNKKTFFFNHFDSVLVGFKEGPTIEDRTTEFLPVYIKKKDKYNRVSNAALIISLLSRYRHPFLNAIYFQENLACEQFSTVLFVFSKPLETITND